MKNTTYNRNGHRNSPPLPNKGRGQGGGSLIQTIIAVTSFIVAVAFSIAGFIVPPEGELHDSNLYLVAQFLLVTTSIFGVSAVVSNIPSRPPRRGGDD